MRTVAALLRKFRPMFLYGINYRHRSRKSFVAPQLFGRLTILERDGTHQNPDRCCTTGQKSVEPTNAWAPNRLRPIGEHMISRTQIRAARAILGWSVRDLAMRAFVSIAAVNLIEAADALPSKSSRQLAAVRATLEAAGIEFLEGDATAGERAIPTIEALIRIAPR